MSKTTATARATFELLRPAFLTGFTFPDWIRILRENRWDIDTKYLPRAAVATLGTIATSCLKPFEPDTKLSEDCERLWKSPLFILGLPRSGTTHLFKLLARDPNFAFPTRLDCYNPHTFLLLRRVGLFAILSKLPKFKRAMDNLRVGWASPEEDIVALAILASQGERVSRIFPRNAVQARGIPTDTFKESAKSLDLILCLRGFLQKLTHLHGKKALLKSPGHMGRVKEILEVFPQARFVTIFRNPLNQTASLRALRGSGNPFWCALQRPLCINSTPFQNQKVLLRSYFAIREAIPAEHLFETTFEELVADRSGTISRICEKFSIKPPTNFEALEAKARNARPPGLPPDSWLPLIREHYKPLFDLGLYPEP